MNKIYGNNFPNITEIKVVGCGIEDTEIDELSSLSSLDLSNNNLSATIIDNIISVLNTSDIESGSFVYENNPGTDQINRAGTPSSSLELISESETETVIQLATDEDGVITTTPEDLDDLELTYITLTGTGTDPIQEPGGQAVGFGAAEVKAAKAGVDWSGTGWSFRIQWRAAGTVGNEKLIGAGWTNSALPPVDQTLALIDYGMWMNGGLLVGISSGTFTTTANDLIGMTSVCLEIVNVSGGTTIIQGGNLGHYSIPTWGGVDAVEAAAATGTVTFPGGGSVTLTAKAAGISANGHVVRFVKGGKLTEIESLYNKKWNLTPIYNKPYGPVFYLRCNGTQNNEAATTSSLHVKELVNSRPPNNITNTYCWSANGKFNGHISASSQNAVIRYIGNNLALGRMNFKESWTFEWFYKGTGNECYFIISDKEIGESEQNVLKIYMSGNIYVYTKVDNSVQLNTISGTASWSDSEFRHGFVCYDGTKAYIGQNGTIRYSTAQATSKFPDLSTFTDAQMYIKIVASGDKLDEVILTKGIALYRGDNTKAYTVPSAERSY